MKSKHFMSVCRCATREALSLFLFQSTSRIPAYVLISMQYAKAGVEPPFISFSLSIFQTERPHELSHTTRCYYSNRADKAKETKLFFYYY